MMHSRRLVTLLLAAAIMLAACDQLPQIIGGGDNPGGTPGAPSTGEAPAGPTPINFAAPESVAQAYFDAWQAGDMNTMYSLLSETSRAQYPIEAFTAQYTQAAEAMTQQSVTLDVDMTRLNVAPETARLRFDVVYQTIVLGEIEKDMALNLKLENGRWSVVWDPSMILPELAGGNTLALNIDYPARANIYDRKGAWLVQSESPTATLSVIPSLVGEPEDEEEMLAVLSGILRMPASIIQSSYQGFGPTYEQAVAVGDVDREVLDDIWSDIYSYEAIQVSGDKFGRRNYYNVAPHIVGYTGYIPVEQLDAYRTRGYAGNEIVGLAGLEAWGEDILAGTRGGTLTAVTPLGEVSAQVASRESQPAQNLYLTIDRELQVIVQDALEDAYVAGEATWSPTASGAAAVVIDVRTGEVLAIASYPYFDANVYNPFNGNPLSSDSYFGALNADPRKPYFNRVTQGAFPPGSIFKVITAAAALASGEFTGESQITCNGMWRDNPSRLDWKEEGHGTVTLTQAISGSCNPFFFEIGYVTGQSNPNLIPEWARHFGLGQVTGIEIEEEEGLIPDPAYKQEATGEEWSTDDSMNIAVGQGDMLVTPIQMVNVFAAIANGGTLYRPHLVRAIGPSFDAPSNTVQPEVIGTVPLSPEYLAVIQTGMRGVTSIIDLGTAENRVGSMQISSAGKTGTAQVSAQGAQPIAWFAGYVPYEAPEIAVIIMVENGGQGSTIASPIFRRIIEEWYGLPVFHWPDDWYDPELFEFVQEIGE